ncbi:coiled-coil domain-containing protein 82-like isoform X1 [Huso huso]|uniref:Coiled-coil domain-containing protein 82-like isoform X1 n=1 Tax=Huso huso TaxID=61971 RepID=A0ABR0ZNP5_HUSHU
MESANSSIAYKTRRRTRSEEKTVKSRIDRRRTRIGFLSHLQDSDDDSDLGFSSKASDTESQFGESDAASSSSSRAEEGNPIQENPVGDDCDKECVAPKNRRKRTSSNVFLESDSESNSGTGGAPVRKCKAKKRYTSFREDSEASDENTEWDKSSAIFNEKKEKEDSNRVKERQIKLKQLSQKIRARRGSYSNVTLEDSDDESFQGYPVTLSESNSDEENGSMKDFIDDDDDEEENNGAEFGIKDEAPAEKSFMINHIPLFSSCSHYSHFQTVVKALLINALDNTFLKSLYDGTRRKKYAQEMRTSLHFYDERFVLPRLENLKQRSRWKERYKERVECYPSMKVVSIGVRRGPCQACEMHRHSKYMVILSGQQYDTKTLEDDSFMPHDKQGLNVGSVCVERTQVYHRLRHFKYHLFKLCCSVLEQEEEHEDEPVKDVVLKVYSLLDGQGWIKKQYDQFEDCLNDADYFQEEKLD